MFTNTKMVPGIVSKEEMFYLLSTFIPSQLVTVQLYICE